MGRFDSFPSRRGLSVKWDYYDADVLPLWVADMDFPAPEPVTEAMKARAASGQFGYEMDAPALREVIAARMTSRHAMPTTGDDVLFLPGLVFGLNVVTRTFGAPGSPVVIPTPVYQHFIYAAENFQRPAIQVEIPSTLRDGWLYYELDFDALEAAVTPEASVFMLCNPHNPIGRAFTRAELEQVADFCLRHNLVICSDEIHADLLHPEGTHISMASLSPEVAARTITLVAPSKTYNVPGLQVGAAIIPNRELRDQFVQSSRNLGVHASPVGFAGALAAYTMCEDWLTEALDYLTGNRDALLAFVRACWPNVLITKPEATYLAYLDFRSVNLPKPPFEFFLNHARVALSDGPPFGKGGEGRVRLNYGTSRDVLMEALARMDRALKESGAME
ncbi:MAG: PatB family C-S lyase [Anaerolineae bacterium]